MATASALSLPLLSSLASSKPLPSFCHLHPHSKEFS